MALLDRIQRSTGVAGENVKGHSFESAMTLYFHEIITRQNIINLFSIPVGFEADLDKFKTKYNSFPGTAAGGLARTEWVQDFLACVIGLQLGEISKTQFNTFLGLDLSGA